MLKDEEIKIKDSIELSDFLFNEDIPEYQKKIIAKELLLRTCKNATYLEVTVIYTAMEKLSMEEIIEFSKGKNPLTASIAYSVMESKMMNAKNSDFISDIEIRATSKVKVKSKSKSKRKHKKYKYN